MAIMRPLGQMASSRVLKRGAVGQSDVGQPEQSQPQTPTAASQAAGVAPKSGIVGAGIAIVASVCS